jgi:hypothetical protein
MFMSIKNKKFRKFLCQKYKFLLIILFLTKVLLESEYRLFYQYYNQKNIHNLLLK